MSSGPNDEATQFLLDTMHNPQISMRYRMDAAYRLLELHGAEAFATRWVTDPRDPSPDPSQPLFKIVIGGLPDGASVTVEPTTKSVSALHRYTAPILNLSLAPWFLLLAIYRQVYRT
jgi:hypothetical protein